MSTKVYTLDKHNLLRVSHQTGLSQCARCGKQLKPRDTVIRKGPTGNSRYYHAKCYNSLYIEVSA